MKKFLSVLPLALLLVFATFYPAESKDSSPDLTKEIRELRKDISRIGKDVSYIKKDIRKIKDIIIARAPSRTESAGIKVDIKGDPVMGSSGAKVFMVEFSDYECPFCAGFYRNTLPKIRKKYINTGKVKHVYKDFPLSFHKKAAKAAEAAYCAGEKGKFWEMHDMIFSNQKRMSISDLVKNAKKLGLKKRDFKKCLKEGRYANDIQKDFRAGGASGVRGTPSFIVGRLNGKGEVEGSMLRGAQPFEVFESAIDAMLGK
ncbi:MAG: thioredoxin [bacterium]|nr:MAG: thioredoxin [bacterium]